MKSARAKSQAELWGDLGPPTIGFRLDDKDRRLLSEQAGRARMTPHAFARYVLVHALRQPERISAIERAVIQLGEEVDQVRSDLAIVTEALLVTAGEQSQADAKLWVTQNLKSE